MNQLNRKGYRMKNGVIDNYASESQASNAKPAPR